MKKNIIILILIFIAVIFFVFSYIQRIAANSQREETERLKTEVEECKHHVLAVQQEAEMQRLLALKNEQMAIEQLSRLQEELKKGK